MDTKNTKREKGQYFTQTNPFTLPAFKKWTSFLPNNATILEPFAGANNIVKMLNNINPLFSFASFDILPNNNINMFSKVNVVKQDTLKKMPTGYDCIVTNPPYLAKNSATRRGIEYYENNKYDDLYKFAVEKCLDKYNFVAAIIPESFITANIFREKLFATISLTTKMFNDTQCPVCLALWTDLKTKIKQNLNGDDFLLFNFDKFIDTYSNLSNKYKYLIKDSYSGNNIKFNDPNGIIGLKGVDNISNPSIEFIQGKYVDPSKIKPSSRAITRISFNNNNIRVEPIIDYANDLLLKFRQDTKDIFLTSFKGLRRDGYYRRRLDFKLAKSILNYAYENV